MKNKKGFTLIELMAVITILVILSLIIVPIIDKNIKKSKENMYNIQIDNIRIAAKNYYSDNISLIPSSGNYAFVKLSYLIEKGYFEKNVKNPKTGKVFTDDIYIQLLNDYGFYEYKVCPLEDGCQDYSDNGMVLGDFLKVRDINPGIICGDLEEEDYYGNDICYINSTEDLLAFSNLVNSKYTFTNKTVILNYSLDFTNPKSYSDPNIKSFGDVNLDGVHDILINELSSKTSSGFPTIGNSSNKFLGTFEGNAHKIANVYIDNNGKNMVGFFGYNGGVVRGLILDQITVKGKNNTGGIVGYNVGNIYSSKISGNVFGNERVGLICGHSENAEIVDIIASGNVSGTASYVGGLLGSSSYNKKFNALFRNGSVSSSSNNAYNIIGTDNVDSKYNIVALDTITVNRNGTVSATNHNNSNVYLTDIEGIKSISIAEQVLDTYIGLDNNNDGYYFDYNEFGEIDLYDIEEKPLLITMTGNGTEISPFIINSYDDLKQVSYDLSKVYSLNSDIDFENKNILMISSKFNPFTGTFIGNDKTIDNFRIIGIDETGLFGRNSGKISGLKFLNPYIKGRNNVGLISGNNSGIINGIWIDNVDSRGSEKVGGAVGVNTGTVNSLEISGIVNGKIYVGIAVGHTSNGNIINVLVDGDAIGKENYVGGIAGYTNYGKINAFYRSGSVNLTGTASSVHRISGYSNGTTINAGSSSSISIINNGNTNASTSTNFGSENGYTFDSEQIKNIANYEYSIDTYIGNDNDNDGYYFDYNDLGEVQLFSVKSKPLDITMQGSGTSDDPYVIHNYDELIQVSYDLSSNYILNNDLDVSSNYKFILSSNSNHFKGFFNGNGKKISGFSNHGVNYTGMFGYNEGTINDLVVDNINLAGSNYVGLVSYNTGNVAGIRILNMDSKGNDNVALVSGYNKGNVTGIKANGNVTGNNSVGLIVGRHNKGNVEGIVSGDLKGNTNVGSIVGCNDVGNTDGIYLSGNVTGSSDYNLLIGYKGGSNYALSGNSANLLNNNTVNSSNISGSNGYLVTEDYLNSISLVDAIVDTFVGGDNNLDGFYYDYDENGVFDVFSVRRTPLDVTMQGDGTSENPYIINNYEELKQATYNISNSYLLNNNIDMSGQNPLIFGGYTNTFTGDFNGNGYEISNFDLYGYNSVGFIGRNKGTIRGLKLKNVNVYGYDYVGIVSGASYNNITSVSVSGNVNGNNYVGLVVGKADSTNVEAIASGNVVGKANVGGIVGSATESNIYSIFLDGTVVGSSNYSRIVGYSNGSTLRNASLDTNTVGGKTVNSTTTDYSSGYSINSSGINNIALADAVIDTYVNGDNNSDGCYYDNDIEGNIDVFCVVRNPLNVTMQGSGTNEDPYIINNYDELKQATYNLSYSYRLNNDIDLSGKNPLLFGSINNYFTGVFDGNGYTISNMNLVGYNDNGVFGYNTGIIKGLKLHGISVTGNNEVGIVSGYNKGKITSVNVNGIVLGDTYVGGIVGRNGNGAVEGIVSSEVIGKSYVGGVVGIFKDGNLNVIYTDGSVTGTSNVKRVGFKDGGTYVALSHSDILKNGNVITTSSSITGSDGYSVNDENINNISLVENSLDTFVGGDNNLDNCYYDYNSNNKIDVFCYNRNPLVVTMEGAGTLENPYLINNLQELKQASYNPNLVYKLMNNIDLSSENPIILGSSLNNFNGMFDGNTYKISGITLRGYDDASLFGVNNGTIKGLELENINVYGNNNIGLLVSNNLGSISFVKASGNVSGSSYVGLISGRNSNIINQVVVSGNASGTSYVGGIVGTQSNGSLVGANLGGSLNCNSYVYRIGRKNEGTFSAISSDSVLINNYTVSSSSLGSNNGKDTANNLLNTLDPYIEAGFNTSITDPLTSEYIWYIDNDIIKFRKN